MKAVHSFVVAATLCAGLAACSEEDTPKDYTLGSMLTEVALKGTHVWVSSNEFLIEPNSAEFNGTVFHDLNSLLSALRVAGFSPDTSLPEGRVDVVAQKFGCAYLRKAGYNFFEDSGYRHLIRFMYYTDECACRNEVPHKDVLQYRRYDGWFANQTQDTIFVADNYLAKMIPHFYVTSFSKTYFEGNIVDDSRSYKFELMSKATLISAGLTELDD